MFGETRRRQDSRSTLSNNYENSVIGKRIAGIHNGHYSVIMRNVNAQMINGEHLLTQRAPVAARTIAVSNKLLYMFRYVTHTFSMSE